MQETDRVARQAARARRLRLLFVVHESTIFLSFLVLAYMVWKLSGRVDALESRTVA